MDPDRNVNRLHRLFGVSHTIQKQTTRRLSVTDQEHEEQERKRAQHFKELRQQRISSLGANQRYALEICADLLGMEMDEVVMGIVDDVQYCDLLGGMFEDKGPRACMISNVQVEGYPQESGRYNDKQKYLKVRRAMCIKSENVKLIDKWVVLYRNNNNKAVENRNVSDEIAMFRWIADKPDLCLFVIKVFMDQILTKSLEAVPEFGVAEKEQRHKFFHNLGMYNMFLKASEETVASRVNFEVSHQLFKGRLLVKWQIEESSKNIPRVRMVEQYFSKWLRQIQGILVEGKQILRDGPDVGPLQMLVNWRRMLARYTSITEFVSSRAFNNHKHCLTLSRSSKLLKVRDT